MHIEGDANDYVGKGLSGGKIVIYPPNLLHLLLKKTLLLVMSFYMEQHQAKLILGVWQGEICR